MAREITEMSASSTKRNDRRVRPLAAGALSLGAVVMLPLVLTGIAGCPDASGGGGGGGASHCESDADCDDGRFCNGVETCDAEGACQDGPAPCPAELCDEPADFCPSGCGEPADFVGTWLSDFECTSSCGDGFEERILLVVTQSGEDAVYTDPDGFPFEGTICDDIFTWSGTGDGFTESGTWTLIAEDTITKTSHYRGADPPNCEGDCTGTLARQ